MFVTKKERKEYAELLDVAAISCIEDKDRFYCPNQACSALYQFTNNKCAAYVLRCPLCMSYFARQYPNLTNVTDCHTWTFKSLSSQLIGQSTLCMLTQCARTSMLSFFAIGT